jgi:hypothetical protein
MVEPNADADYVRIRMLQRREKQSNELIQDAKELIMELRHQRNLSRWNVIVYVILDGILVILAIAKPDDILVYGEPSYKRLSSRASYNKKWKRVDKSKQEIYDSVSYRVSTTDGIRFNFTDPQGNSELIFTGGILSYPDLIGKTFDNIEVDQLLYQPLLGNFNDPMTIRIYSMLEKLIDSDTNKKKDDSKDPRYFR